MAVNVNLLLTLGCFIQVHQQTVHCFIDGGCIGLQGLAVEHGLYCSSQAAPLGTPAGSLLIRLHALMLSSDDLLERCVATSALLYVRVCCDVQ